jgi:hypothetical protein
VSFSRSVALLGGLLVIQVGLVAWTWRGPAAEVAPHRLFSLDASAVDAVVVTPRSDLPPPLPPVRLEKHDKTWTIASADGYPTDGARWSEVLQKLVEADVLSPIASSAASHAALKVGPDSYERKVEIHAGNQAVTAFLGTTAAGTVNVRLDGADDVYAIRGLTVFDLGPEARTFAPTAVLDLDTDRTLSLTVRNPRGSFTLRHDAGVWTSDVPVDDNKATALVRRITRLRLLAPVGRTRDPAFGLDGSLRLEWTMTDGSAGGYTAGNVDGAEAWLQRDDSPFVVRVPMLPIVGLREAVIADLAP